MLELEFKRNKSVIETLKKEIERLKNDLTKTEEPYNAIDKPKFRLSEIENTLKLADKFTLKQIIEYLKLDSYELVKNLARITNKENCSEVIAHRDGALQRNESLIRLLEKYSTEKTFYDKLK